MRDHRQRKGDGHSLFPRSRRLWTAILVGLAMGLIVSLGTFSSREYRQIGLLERRSSNLATKFAEQEELLAEEKRRRGSREIMADEQGSRIKELEIALEGLRQQQRDARLKAEAATKEAATHKAELDSARTRLQQLQQDASTQSSSQAGGAGGAADRHTPWQPSAERDAKDPELAALLRKVAIDNEVVVAISNKNYAGVGNMLDTWMEHVKRAGVKNAMVVALDEPTRQHADSQGVASQIFKLEVPDSQKDVGENHAVSGLKFRILRRFLDLGYAVLLSDVDIVTLQNPFKFLARDCDVESMSDGWDNATAYGYNDVKDDPSMGWARYAHSMRVFVFNSGLFYIRPTQASIALLDTVAHRLATENGWDQAIFNEVIFFPSHGPYKDPAVTRRVLDIYDFMNSKVLFTNVRHNPLLRDRLPVMVHVNYHPEKHQRMLALIQHYLHHDSKPMMAFPNGSQ